MSVLDQLAENDLVVSAVYEALALRQRKSSRTGFIDICCPMCVSRGETVDKKFRCGIKHSDGIGVNCFNCGFKAKFRVGERLSASMKKFLGNMGVAHQDIQKLTYWADTMQRMLASRPDIQAKLHVSVMPEFDAVPLPASAKSIENWAQDGCDDPNFLDTAAYLFSRGDAVVAAGNYYWSPDSDYHLNRRLIIPCYHQNRLVGWTGRSISDDIKPKYHKEVPNNYIFNSKFLTIPERQYVFIVEGVLDALVTDAIGALGASLNDIQIAWIIQSGKQPVVVADRDKSGERLVEIAIQYGWPVATMHYGRNQWWDSDIKDADDAVKRYGKLYTVQSILANLTWEPKQILQRIRYRI